MIENIIAQHNDINCHGDSFTVVRTLTGHKSNMRCLDFHPYGDFVASGSLDTNIKVSSYPTTDIERRSQNSYTALCNGDVSHGAPIGGIRVFADHTSGNKRKQGEPKIFMLCVAFHTCLSSRLDSST